MACDMSVGGTGARVRRQEVPVADRTITDRAAAAPLRDPGQDLVPEPTSQVETTEGGRAIAQPPARWRRVTWYMETGSGRGWK